jgi:hypothetical protein
MMQQEQGQNGPERFKAAAYWLTFICRALAFSLEVFLHKSSSFGRRYVGMQALVATLIIFFFPVLMPEHDPRPLHGFLLLFLAMCLLVRVSTFVRRCGGDQVHSFYNGEPRLSFLTRWTSELTVKRGLQPLLVFVGGALTLSISQPLGAYLMLAAFGLGASVSLSAGFDETRAMDMRDSFIEQRQLAERFRGGRRD